jgi:hypothetical protein
MSVGSLTGLSTPVSQPLFHCKNSVEVFVRHTKNCPQRSSGRDFRKCKCPKYLYIYKNSAASRVSAKTGSWSEAEKKAQEGA